MNNLGRDKVEWKPDIWSRIDQAVHDEAKRTKIAVQFLPHRPYPDAMTVPSDTIDPETMRVDPGAVTPLVEIWVEFSLTAEQVHGEQELQTATTLATRAANLLSQGQDLLVFRGQSAVATHPLFKSKKVQLRSGPPGPGLLKSAGDSVIAVLPTDKATRKYGENTVGAVTEGYARLQARGQYGPYALVLQTVPYADTYAPLPNTLIMPADRIKPLVTDHFYGTGTLPGADESQRGPFSGLLVSLGGNSMDLVIGMDATTGFMQVDADGLYRFRVLERFALRIKDATAIIALDFAAAAAAVKAA